MEALTISFAVFPADVTMVRFSRPPNFKYLSGQWVRLGFTAFQPSEYHSLTLTSAPHENYLSVHVKAQGPWTWKLRNFFDPNNMQIREVPKVCLSRSANSGMFMLKLVPPSKPNNQRAVVGAKLT